MHMTVALLVLSLIVEDGQALEVRRSLRLRFNVVMFVLYNWPRCVIAV